MSSDANTPARELEADTAEYDKMLDTIDVAIDEARRKVESGRVYDPENEKVRIKWIRAMAYSLNVRRQIENDRTLEELAERIERLEERDSVDGLGGDEP